MTAIFIQRHVPIFLVAYMRSNSKILEAFCPNTSNKIFAILAINVQSNTSLILK